MRKIVTFSSVAVESALGKTGRVSVRTRADGKIAVSAATDGLKLSTRSGRSTATLTLGQDFADKVPEGELVTVLTADRNAEGNPEFLLVAAKDRSYAKAHAKA